MYKYTWLFVFSFIFIGIFGFNVNVHAQGAVLPVGCTSTVGYSPDTGVKCDTIIDPLLPLGCINTHGYSPVTGAKCDSAVSLFPPGCTSTSAFSITTGQPCNNNSNFLPGCYSTQGFSSTTGRRCDEIIIVSPTIEPSITVLSPNGGENYNPQISRQIKVKWNMNYQATSSVLVMIMVLDDFGKYGSQVVSEMTNPTIGDNSWTVYSSTNWENGREYKIQVCDRASTATTNPICDYSDNIFTINSSTTQPSITVLNPNGGETWQKGTDKNISWKSNQPSKRVNIELRRYPLQSNPSDAIVIANDVPNTSNYLWNVGKFIFDYKLEDGRYLMEVCTIGVGGLCDQSDATFLMTSGTITPPLTLLSPNGGELVIGKEYTIEWKNTDPSKDTTAYLMPEDKGEELFLFTASAGTFSKKMVIPSVPAGNYRILIFSGINAKDFSDSYFTIVAPQPEPLSNSIISGMCIVQSVSYSPHAADVSSGKIRIAGTEYSVSLVEGMYGNVGSQDFYALRSPSGHVTVNGVAAGANAPEGVGGSVKVGTVVYDQQGVSNILNVNSSCQDYQRPAPTSSAS